jgi:hypothetical protein
MFNIKRVLLLAGMRLGIPEAIQFAAPPLPPMLTMIPRPGHFRRIGAAGSRDRLHLDRSSSAKKLQRWLNNGEIVQQPPNEKAMQRHAWHRREKAAAAFRASLPRENRLDVE